MEHKKGVALETLKSGVADHVWRKKAKVGHPTLVGWNQDRQKTALEKKMTGEISTSGSLWFKKKTKTQILPPELHT